MKAKEKVKALRDMCRKISVWKLTEALEEVENCYIDGKIFAGHEPIKVENGVLSGGSPMYKSIDDEVLAYLYNQVIESLSAASKEIQKASEEIQANAPKPLVEGIIYSERVGKNKKLGEKK